MVSFLPTQKGDPAPPALTAMRLVPDAPRAGGFRAIKDFRDACATPCRTRLCYTCGMSRLLKPLWVLLALVFVFEAWLWEHLRPLVAWVVERIAWERLKARTAAGIEHLPPYATLLVFLVPVILLFPLKLAGLWMLAHGSWLGAMAVLALA